MYIKNKTIIITGASKGIGKTLALELAEYSCNLILIARSENELLEIQATILKSKKSNCSIFVGDISNLSFLDLVVSKTIEKFKQIDFLINNAGIAAFGSIQNFSEEEFYSLFETNVKASFFLSQKVLPFMKKSKSGQIVTIISDVGKRVFDTGALYCATKYAQEAFTSAMRMEVRPFNIKVSNIYSGLVDSDFHATRQGSKEHQYWLKTEDMAKSIIFVMNQAKNVVIDELMIHPISQEY